MKTLLFILGFCVASCLCATAQTDTAQMPPVIDTIKVPRPASISKPVKKPVLKDTVRRVNIRDSLMRVDSVALKDSVARVLNDSLKKSLADSAQIPVVKPVIKRPFDSFYRKMLDNPFLRSTAKPIYLVVNERQRNPKDEMFYLLVGLLFFLAFIKLLFSRYFDNVFRLFFQPSFRQKQTREQLLQSNLPSLLLNLFFILSGAAYVTFLLKYYNMTTISFWSMLLYCSIALAALYAGKFIFLTFAGWVFNVKDATDSYIFAVYLMNKIIGVILVPFTLIIAFSNQHIINISITISLLLLFLLFIYRYVVSYGPVRRDVKVSPLHFLMYVFAFEIIPLLLIYKTLIIYMDKSL